MIVKHYREATRFRDPRERAGAAAEKQMAHYLHRKFQDSLAVCVLHQLRIEDPDQPEQDGSVGVCQIDHLVVHRWGFFLVESKSVTEAVQVRSDGDGGDEWSRTYRGEQRGIPSPIRQAKRQSEFLRTFLQRQSSGLLGRLPFGMRWIGRTLGQGDHRGFTTAPMQLVIAVSDGGRIDRLDGWQPPSKPFRVFVQKADLVPEKIEGGLARHRVGARLFDIRFVGSYGLWRMKAEEVRRVADYLARCHRDRSTESSETVGANAPAKHCGFAKRRNRHPRAYGAWSAEEERDLLRLREAGLDNRELAERFGRTPGAISSRLRKLAEWRARGARR